MSVYKVKEGQELMWPSGDVRARSGRIVELFENHECPAVQQLAREWVGPQMKKLDKTDGPVDKAMPAHWMLQLVNAAGLDATSVSHIEPTVAKKEIVAPAPRVIGKKGGRKVMKANVGVPEGHRVPSHK